MKQEKKTLSYYRLRLEVYLKDYHPQLLGDETFIRERSEAAAKTYEEAWRTMILKRASSSNHPWPSGSGLRHTH